MPKILIKIALYSRPASALPASLTLTTRIIITLKSDHSSIIGTDNLDMRSNTQSQISVINQHCYQNTMQILYIACGLYVADLVYPHPNDKTNSRLKTLYAHCWV